MLIPGIKPAGSLQPKRRKSKIAIASFFNERSRHGKRAGLARKFTDQCGGMRLQCCPSTLSLDAVGLAFFMITFYGMPVKNNLPPP